MELIDRALTVPRYSRATKLEKPMPFSEFAKDKDYDIVQVQSIKPLKNECVGFFGVFEWKNNELRSIDHDDYNKDMIVFGYEEFTCEIGGKKAAGIDVLVEEW